MKNELIGGLVSKVLLALGTAAAVGGSGAIIASASTNAVQDQRLTSLEADRQVMKDLSEKLDETNKNVAVLNARLEARNGE